MFFFKLFFWQKYQDKTTQSLLIIDSPNNWPSLVKTRKKNFPKKTFFSKCFFFPKICFEKNKKMFFLSKNVLCYPQKVTKFCCKKKTEKYFWEKTFFFYTKNIFKNVLKKKHCFVFHKNVVPSNWPPSWKQRIFFSRRGGGQLFGNFG